MRCSTYADLWQYTINASYTPDTDYVWDDISTDTGSQIMDSYDSNFGNSAICEPQAPIDTFQDYGMDDFGAATEGAASVAISAALTSNTMTELISQVNVLLKEVTAEAILPQYRALHSNQIQEKTPGDYVTAADLASEAMLKKGLTALLPGSQVVGEEEISANPDLLDELDEDLPIWVIDPLDGTINFVKGIRGFAIQLALVEKNVTTLAWIHDPESGRTAWAEKGKGAVVDGEPLHIRPADQMKGVLYASKFAPPEIAEQVDKTRHLVNEETPMYCSAWEYMRLCFNEIDFCLFTRLMPWDHAPGSLIYTEAGGLSRCIDGEEYTAGDMEKKGLLLAPNEASWNALHHTLFGE